MNLTSRGLDLSKVIFSIKIPGISVFKMSITRQVSKVLVITHWDPNSSPVLSTSEFAVSKMYCLSMKIGMSYPARNLAGLVISRALSSGLFVVVTNSSTTSLVVTPGLLLTLKADG